MHLSCPLRLQATRSAGAPRASGPSRTARPWLTYAISQGGPQGGDASPLGLPGGGVWLGRGTSGDLVYGSGYKFVLRRPRVGGEGLVRRPATPKPVRRQQASRQQGLVPARQPAQGGAGLSLVGLDIASCSVVIDTDFQVVEEAEGQQAAAAAAWPGIQPNTTCTGIVPLFSVDEETEAEPAPRHPRRTRRVRFTCNLCGTSNAKETNPHAWNNGSVFMRCEGCSAVHKLKDNLNIFHELRGPIFPPPHLRNSFLVQEVLDKIEARRLREGAEGRDHDGGLLN